MKLVLATLLLSQALLVQPAAAEPCVGLAFDKPFPGAVDVVVRQTDVPAAQFPGVWQEGMIEGQFFQIFANRIAVLQADRIAPAWSITVNCQQRPCAITVIAQPPASAMATTKRLEECLVPPEIKTAEAPKPKKAAPAKAEETGPKDPAPEKKEPPPKSEAAAKPAADTTPKPKPKPEPKPEPKLELAPDPKPVEGNVPLAGNSAGFIVNPTSSVAGAAAPSGQVAAVQAGNAGASATCPPPQTVIIPVAAGTCRTAVIAQSDPITTLQQLLIMAGADPGDVDGRYGLKTEEAVLEVLGYRGRDYDVVEAIAAIDAYLCERAR